MASKAYKRIYLPTTVFHVAKAAKLKGIVEWEDYVHAACLVFACTVESFCRSYMEIEAAEIVQQRPYGT